MQVSRLTPDDRARWTDLWRDYLAFYETALPDDIYALTWARIMNPAGPIFALGVRDETGRLAGITHYLVHAHAWSSADACYLQDLFVAADARGLGYARALIAGVAAAARERGCARLYWLTQETNERARRLYDRIAAHTGFIRYDFPL